jgi:predicted transposase YbfD/YdcC
MSLASLSIKKHFARLKDPRRRHCRRHRLLDIVAIALCAVIADCNTWTEIALFGRRREAWLRRFLSLPNGIPSHDTFERVFKLIDPHVFQLCLRDWTLRFAEAIGMKHVAVDGKSLRGSRDAVAKLGPLHLVSAWATHSRVTLGQVAVDSKSNEITAIPKLLELLDVRGALVTIDAMGCQKEIAAKIRERGAHYALTVKDNQPHLRQALEACFAQAEETEYAGLDHDACLKRERGHGREETRTCTIIRHPQGIPQLEDWRDVSVIGMCCSERVVNQKSSVEIRYFIGSKNVSARYYAAALRHHWKIENHLHWHMDVSFREDADRTQERNAAQNMALLRRQAMTLLKQDSGKESIACKRKQAAWDPDFLEAIVKGTGNLGNQ